MKPRPLYAAFALACCLALPLRSQNPTPTVPPTTSPAPAPKPNPFQPAADQAPGAAPNKVWLNTATNVYHCPGERFYGRTKEGKYLTEPQAIALKAHGPRGQTCFK